MQQQWRAEQVRCFPLEIEGLPSIVTVYHRDQGKCNLHKSCFRRRHLLVWVAGGS